MRRIERLERDKAKLIEDRDRWKRRSEHLEKELEAARRAGRRQAAPFAKDRPQGSGRPPGRRAGAEYGKHGCRRPPTRVDETYAAPAPTTCPDCGGAVALDRVAAQYQEDLPEVRPLVRRFNIEVGHCSRCRCRVQGRHALQTSDALGVATAQLGPNVAALVGRGREPGCPHPPAQIRTCALTHTAPTLGGGRQTACRAKGAEPARGVRRQDNIHHHLLDDLVFQGSNAERSRPAVRSGYFNPSRRQRPIRSRMYAAVQVEQPLVRSVLVRLPHQTTAVPLRACENGPGTPCAGMIGLEKRPTKHRGNQARGPQ